MEPLISTVVICEENKTRAELYALWLDAYDVRTAVTEQQATEKISGTTGVAVINDQFCDGAAASVLDTIQSQTAVCRVIAMRERETTSQHLTVDHQLVKPIFEDELSEMVEMLMRRSNYHFALTHYYRTTLQLSTFETKTESEAVDTEQYERLQQRVTHLKPIIVRLQQQLTQRDLIAIQSDVSSNVEVSPKKSERVDSKYRPTSCSACDETWDQSSTDGGPNVTQLGAYVWRCGHCGHVQMGTDPNHQNIY